jgi:LSD1 subclass zinc finger protein
MSFWEKIKQSLRNFMTNRNGVDPLSVVLVWGGLAIYLLSAIFSSTILSLVSFAIYAYTVFRIFSRNKEKRALENRRYLALKTKYTTEFKQARTRLKNRKKFRYFRCPSCKAWLKLPRGAGVVTVTCGRCHNNFTQKG